MSDTEYHPHPEPRRVATLELRQTKSRLSPPIEDVSITLADVAERGIVMRAIFPTADDGDVRAARHPVDAFIIDELRTSARTRRSLVAHAKQRSISEATLDRHLTILSAAGEVVKAPLGREVVFDLPAHHSGSLIEQDEEVEEDDQV